MTIISHTNTVCNSQTNETPKYRSQDEEKRTNSIFANFLRDDWSANIARKAGFTDFADWLENKDKKESKDNSVLSNIVRAAINHPVITLATITATVFAGKYLYSAMTKNTGQIENIAETQKIVKKEYIAPKAEPLAERIESLNKSIQEGVEYEESIGFKNLDIFKNVSEKEREQIVQYFIRTKKQKELLLFASGQKPGMLEGIQNFNDDVFDALRSDSVSVVEFFTKEKGNLILNNEAAKKVISENKELFIKRLELPADTSIGEILRQIRLSGSSKLQNPNEYIDLKELLQGTSQSNAYNAQIVQDLKNWTKYHKYSCSQVPDYYGMYFKGFEEYKEYLKKALDDSRSSYKNMGKDFIDKLKRTIDTLTLKAYKNIVQEPLNVFNDGGSEIVELQALKNLAAKLDRAKQFGTSISF